MFLVLSPKRNDETEVKKNEMYAYYASYSQSFAMHMLKSQKLGSDSLVIDPWNGSGTTTYASSLIGYKSIGLDLNPAMTVIAQARQSGKNDINSAKLALNKLTSNFKGKINSSDPLNNWFTSDSVDNIRKIEKFILGKAQGESVSGKIAFIKNEKAILYLSLFKTIRFLLSSFIPSNPTWIKLAKGNDEKVSISWIELKKIFIRSSIESCDILDKGNDFIKYPLIVNGSSKNIPLDDESVDFVLSSPPYCTRIDYAVATFPELALLCSCSKEIKLIRRALMGTTTVPKSIIGNAAFGKTCNEFLGDVFTHDSRASSTYYFKNFHQYFSDLSMSIKELSRVIKRNSKCVLVVQDSYYKNIHCNLPKIIIEMCREYDLEHLNTVEFISKRNMANINSKSKKYRNHKVAIECVLTFIKG